MATDKQIQANRRNAQLSTGPKSKEALDQLGQRARKHSLAGGHAILPYEKAEDYDALRDDLYADYAPASTQECLLVDGIAQQQWKLQRANRLEVAQLTTQYNAAMHAMKTAASHSTEPTVLDPDRALAMSIAHDPTQLLVLHRYTSAIERSLHRFITDLRIMQKERRREEQRPDSSEQTPNPEIGFEPQKIKSESSPAPRPLLFRLLSPFPVVAFIKWTENGWRLSNLAYRSKRNRDGHGAIATTRNALHPSRSPHRHVTTTTSHNAPQTPPYPIGTATVTERLPLRVTHSTPPDHHNSTSPQHTSHNAPQTPPYPIGTATVTERLPLSVTTPTREAPLR